MGGRGAFSENGKLLRRDWYTVKTIHGIKVLARYDGQTNGKTPTMSASPNSMYAIINSKGRLKSIVEYDEDRQIKREYHYDHSHNGKRPHIMTYENGAVADRGADYVDNEQIRSFLQQFKGEVKRIVRRSGQIVGRFD